jgi:hypothetical protein
MSSSFPTKHGIWHGMQVCSCVLVMRINSNIQAQLHMGQARSMTSHTSLIHLIPSPYNSYLPHTSRTSWPVCGCRSNCRTGCFWEPNGLTS